MNAYKINGFIYVLICLCLFYSFCTSAIVFALALFGETTLGTVTSYDSQLFDQKAAPNESRRISKGYEFSPTASSMAEMSFTQVMRPGRALRKGKRAVSPFDICEFGRALISRNILSCFQRLALLVFFRHLLSMIGSVFLFLLVDGRIVGKRRQKG